MPTNNALCYACGTYGPVSMIAMLGGGRELVLCRACAASRVGCRHHRSCGEVSHVTHSGATMRSPGDGTLDRGVVVLRREHGERTAAQATI